MKARKLVYPKAAAANPNLAPLLRAPFFFFCISPVFRPIFLSQVADGAGSHGKRCYERPRILNQDLRTLRKRICRILPKRIQAGPCQRGSPVLSGVGAQRRDFQQVRACFLAWLSLDRVSKCAFVSWRGV